MVDDGDRRTDGERTDTDRLPALVAAAGGAASDEPSGRKQQARALAALIPVLTDSAKNAGFRAVAAGRWLTDTVVDLVPNITVRDAGTLRRLHPGLTDDDIGDKLVASATKATAAVGAAAGSLAAIEFTALPTLLASPVQLAAETLAVVAVEVKLVAELHELAGLAVPGGMRVAAPAYLLAWVKRGAAEPGESLDMATVLSGATRHELRRRVSRRLVRSATSLAPFMAGAAAGAEVNRRSTRDLGERVRADLRGRQHRRADIVI